MLVQFFCCQLKKTLQIKDFNRLYLNFKAFYDTRKTEIMSQNDDLNRQILEGNLWQVMVKLSLPGILAMLLIGMNAFVDALFVGRLIGKDALAGISLAFPLTYITTGVASMLGVGSASILSRAIGSGDMDRQRAIFGNLTILSLIASIILTIPGYIYAKQLVGFMGGSGTVLNLGVTYYQTLVIGSFFSVYSVSTSMIIRAEGKIKQSMIYTGFSMVLNMVLNPIFISTLGLGVKGAALATIISTTVYSALNFSFFIGGKSSVPIDTKSFKLASWLLPEIFAIGFATLFMQVMTLIQQMLIFKSISNYGSDWDIAFMGATIRIFMLTIIPVFGLMQALQPVLGINFGANNIERVKSASKVFLLAGTGMILLLWSPMQFFPEFFLGMMLPDANFTPNDFNNFRIIMLVLPGFPLIMVGVTMYQSIGNAKMASILTIARQFFLFIPAILILPRFFGLNGIYYSMSGVDIIITLAVAVFMFLEFGKFGKKESQLQQPQAQSQPVEG